MKKIIPVEDAIGKVIPHDITEIVKDSFKGVAFKKGHIITNEDIKHLKRLGKNNIFALQLEKDDIHENEAAQILAEALSGPGISNSSEPQEGKITLKALCDGLLKVDKELLLQFNLLGDVMCSTLHTNTPVKKDEIIAGTRLIPLTTKRNLIDKACAILSSTGKPILSVLPFTPKKAGLVITGSEIFEGTIEDKFESVLREKLSLYNTSLVCVYIAPDDSAYIAKKILECLNKDVDIVITSGGMSVDPDDVTRKGIAEAGATNGLYGSPALPGAMFQIAEIDSIPVLGVPACGMFHKITVLDLVLPRVLTGETMGRREIAELGHGGLCRNCTTCTYPICDFGK